MQVAGKRHHRHQSDLIAESDRSLIGATTQPMGTLGSEQALAPALASQRTFVRSTKIPSELRRRLDPNLWARVVERVFGLRETLRRSTTSMARTPLDFDAVHDGPNRPSAPRSMAMTINDMIAS